MRSKTKKLIWLAPLAAIVAVMGALAIFAAQGPGSVLANSLPGVPTDLKVAPAADEAGRTALVLTWKAPAAGDVTGYRIDKSDDGFEWESLVADTGSTAMTYTDNTLTASDTRWYRVFARNGHGVSAGFDYASGGTKAKGSPGKVQNLTAVADGYKKVVLSWDPPADNGGEKIIGYELQFHNGTQWASIPDAQAIPALTSAVADTTKQKGTTYADDDDGLVAGASRNYRVRAVSGTNTVKKITPGNSTALGATTATETDVSKWSSIKATSKAASAPGQVTGLTAVNFNGDGIRLYWYDPKDTGGWPITHYLIQVHREGQSFPAAPTGTVRTVTASTGALGASDGDFADKGDYYIADLGNSLHQAVFDGINTVDHDYNTTTDAAQAKWYFQVYALTTDPGPDGNAGETADNIIRRSASSSEVASATGGARAGDDPLKAPTVTLTGGTQQIELKIDPPTDDQNNTIKQSAYRIDVSENSGGTWKKVVEDTRFTGFGAGKPYVHVNQPYDATRHYRVFAHTGSWRTKVGLPSANDDASIQSASTSASSAPGQVTGLTASAPNLKTISASWTKPTSDGGQPLIKYQYQYVEDDGDGVADSQDWVVDSNPNITTVPTIHSTSDTSTTLTIEDAGLEAGKVYFIRVRAVNKTNLLATSADRMGAWSASAKITAEATMAPNPVEGLMSKIAVDTNGAVRGVTLIWNKPSSGSDPTHYHIARKIGSGSWQDPTTSSREYDEETNALTDYTDSRHHVAGEMLSYRVRGQERGWQERLGRSHVPAVVRHARARREDRHDHPRPDGGIGRRHGRHRGRVGLLHRH